MSLMMNWSGTLPPNTTEDVRLPKPDPGIDIRSLTNARGKVASGAWQASYTLSEDFRKEFLKMLADITPPGVFRGKTQVVLIPLSIQSPVKIAEGKWKVKMIANLTVFDQGSNLGEVIPFNKEIFVRAVEAPESPNKLDGIAAIVYQVRSSGLAEAVSGKAWVSGKYQLVKGGSGILGSVNGGKEPTGRNLFGDAFKVAVWDVSEVDGMMSQALFFRACMRNSFIDLGCTPYFIGPVPFMTYREKDPIFLGFITRGADNSTSTPTGLKSSGFTFNQSPIVSSSSVSNLLPEVKGNCSKQHSSGTNIDALSTALSGTESNYNSVGNYLCDLEGNCGRPLGASVKILSDFSN